MRFPKILGGSLAMLLAGIILGVASDRLRTTLALGYPKPDLIAPASAHQLLNRGALFLDVRPSEDYLQQHVPGALSLPWNVRSQVEPVLLPYLRKASLVIVYCEDSGCEAAGKISDELLSADIKRVQVLGQGLKGWREAGFPLSARMP